jgi:arabinofuranan 3-O-arabinosyltransferase
MSSPERPCLLKGEASVAVVMLAVVMWGSAAWSVAVSGPLDRFGTLKGTDFAQFYVAARFAAAGRLQFLYDWSAFAADLAKAVPHANGLLYLSVYPPQLAILFAPVARFDYLSALIVWSVISAALYVFSIAMITRYDTALSAQKGTIALLAVAFPPFQQALLHGQIGVLALVAVTVAWWAWRPGSGWLAGFALGSLAFKPQMSAIAVCAVLLRPEWRLLAGVACGVLAQVVAVVVLAGMTAIVGYWGAIERVIAAPQGFEPKLWQMHSLRGAIDLLAGQSSFSLAVWILCVAGVLWLARRAIRRADDLRLQFSAVVIAGLLVNPHLYVYDLVVLAAPLCVIASWLLVRGMRRSDMPLAMTAFAVFWVPLLGPFAALTHIQLTSPLLVILLWHIARAGAETPHATAAASTTLSTVHP